MKKQIVENGVWFSELSESAKAKVENWLGDLPLNFDEHIKKYKFIEDGSRFAYGPHSIK